MAEYTTELKDWITRPEIEAMFHISSSTFSLWRSEGRFGAVTGTMPGRGGTGRDLFTYSMAKVMALYDTEKLAVARRAIAKGLSPSLFPEYCAYAGIATDLPADADTDPLFTWTYDETLIAPVVIWIEAGKIVTASPLYDEMTPYYDGLPESSHADEIICPNCEAHIRAQMSDGGAGER